MDFLFSGFWGFCVLYFLVLWVLCFVRGSLVFNFFIWVISCLGGLCFFKIFVGVFCLGFCVLGVFFHLGGVLIFCFFLVWGFVEVILAWVFCCLVLCGFVFSFCFCGAWFLLCFGFGSFVWGFWCFCALFFHTDAQMLSPTRLIHSCHWCVAALPLPDAALHAGDSVPGARLTS